MDRWWWIVIAVVLALLLLWVLRWLGGKAPHAAADTRGLAGAHDGDERSGRAVATTVAAEPTPTGADDLQLIEGIGPKLDGVLGAAGITTFAALAATAVSDLQAIVDAAGPRFRLADPASWPEQARLAAAGDWDGLKALQATLTAGR